MAESSMLVGAEVGWVLIVGCDGSVEGGEEKALAVVRKRRSEGAGGIYNDGRPAGGCTCVLAEPSV